MYYRRYFSGTISSNTVYRVIKNIATGANTNNYYNQTGLLQSAIKQTLEDVGILCEYGTGDGILQIDGATLQICCSAQNGGINFYTNGITLQSISNSYGSFSGTKYNFYVTLKGDIGGILQVFIGLFNNPQAESVGFLIGKGKDLKDDTEVRVVASGNLSNVNSFYVLKNDRILEGYNTAVEFGQALTNVPALNNSGSDVTLVACVAKPGRFMLNNCYFGNASLAVNNFYNIGGDIYYAMTANILVKCENDQAS